MTLQIAEYGDDQRIYLPIQLLEQSGLKAGDEAEISAKNGCILIEKRFRHKTLEERAANHGGRLGPYEEYDWGNSEWHNDMTRTRTT